MQTVLLVFSTVLLMTCYCNGMRINPAHIWVRSAQFSNVFIANFQVRGGFNYDSMQCFQVPSQGLDALKVSYPYKTNPEKVRIDWSHVEPGMRELEMATQKGVAAVTGHEYCRKPFEMYWPDISGAKLGESMSTVEFYAEITKAQWDFSKMDAYFCVLADEMISLMHKAAKANIDDCAFYFNIYRMTIYSYNEGTVAEIHCGNWVKVSKWWVPVLRLNPKSHMGPSQHTHAKVLRVGDLVDFSTAFDKQCDAYNAYNDEPPAPWQDEYLAEIARIVIGRQSYGEQVV